MFKNLTLYRYTLPEAIGLEQIEQALQAVPFTPCTATQDKAVGFVPARGEEHGALVESVAGQWIAKLMIETKSVPASAIKKKAQAEADHIEATTGRKPGKKEMKALREDALLALLPAAFPRQAVAWIWFNQATGLLAIDASSQGKLDEAITALVRAIDSLAITPLHTRVGPRPPWRDGSAPSTPRPTGRKPSPSSARANCAPSTKRRPWSSSRTTI